MTVWSRASANSLSAASALRDASIWKQTASPLTDVHNQARLDRSSPRSSCTRQEVSSAWRRTAVFWCARIASCSVWNSAAKRLRLLASGSRRDRQSVAGEPRGDAAHGPEAGAVFEQEARPEADAVGRPGEQPRHRGRRYFHRRGWARAAPTPARTADHALVGLDVDLDEGGFLGAVRRIGLPAVCADACIRRRVDLFAALLEPGPPGAAVAGRAGLLAARAFRARLVLLLALAPVKPVRQHRPGRAQLRKLGFQRLDPAPRYLHGFAQPGFRLLPAGPCRFRGLA